MSALFTPLTLPCGAVLKNRIVKSAMSDSLGDGTGHPTQDQCHLYQTWADGGLAAAIVGEVQGDPFFAEKPGNLVLNAHSDPARFAALAKAGRRNGAHLWLQLGHAGAMAYPPISTPKGPSAMDIPGLTCAALTADEIAAIPGQMADTARRGREIGFGGVQVHAAHGFLLSQFLSPLFNQRTDAYGGSITNRMRLLIEVIAAVRAAVGPAYPVAVKLNATDQLEGGLVASDALRVVAALDATSVDLIDISGGTYFPGARAASDAAGGGPYFLEFAKQAHQHTRIPLMVTGGFKTHAQAAEAVECGAADIVGLARALVLHPDLPSLWARGECLAPPFPKFGHPPEGGITAWYTMRLTAIGAGRAAEPDMSLEEAVAAYGARDADRTRIWQDTFPIAN